MGRISTPLPRSDLNWESESESEYALICFRTDEHMYSTVREQMNMHSSILGHRTDEHMYSSVREQMNMHSSVLGQMSTCTHLSNVDQACVVNCILYFFCDTLSILQQTSYLHFYSLHCRRFREFVCDTLSIHLVFRT